MDSDSQLGLAGARLTRCVCTARVRSAAGSIAQANWIALSGVEIGIRDGCLWLWAFSAVFVLEKSPESMRIGGMELMETARILIRPLSLDDVSALTEILSDPEVMKHSVRGVCDEAATRRFVEWCLDCYESYGVGPWALIEKESSTLIGFCGVGPERVGNAEEINLGYRLARRYWRVGIATEAACATLAYAFGTKAFRSVVAIIEPGHIASLRVAEKAGFHGFQEMVFHGKSVRVYRMTHDEWSELQSTLRQPPSGHDAAFLS
ncbi:GNAT family N-acetyltransferase [Azotobacter chroococcum]|nr:GNAT family N-acetyltransferase [Azotobacter chroococcum]